jgi:hypothetical protein
MKNPAAIALGRLGGQKGGLARAAKLSPERRSEIAKKAAEARWTKMKPKELTIQEFFKEYAYALSVTGMAVRLTINPEQLHDQLAGRKYPEPDQLQALENAIRDIGVELLAIQIVTPEYKIGQTEGFEGMIKRSVRGTKDK